MSDETTSAAGTTNNTGDETTTTAPPAGGDTQQGTQDTTTTEAGTQTETKDAPKEGEDQPYEFKLPEGVEIDKDALAHFEPVLKEQKVSPEHAQKLVDAYTKLRQAEAAKHDADWKAQQQKWAEEIKADNTFGGQNFDANVQGAQALMRQFGDPELADYLDRTGLGAYPPLVRFMMKLGRAAAEDTIHRGGPSTTPRAPEEVMYPTMIKQQ